MRFIRRCLIAAGYVLVLLGSARAVTIGDTAVLSAPDDGNGNLLLAQSVTLAQTATIQSLSFYVTSASGNLILGIYDATGPKGGPGKLKASTASFTPKTGWNTANVATPVSLTAGAYWLAYLPSSSNLRFVKTNVSGNCAMYGYNFGAMPSTFSTSPASCTPARWSFYATLAVASAAVNGACGSSNGATLGSAPSANLCSGGTASTVTGAGPWTWNCAGSNGGATATCSALKVASSQAVNGVCGSSNGATLASAPTANLCSVGTASAVSGTGPWRWNCASGNGGATASCSASLQAASGGSGSTGSGSSTSGSVPFVALHTYYMSPTGSDSNNGLTAATAWATPSHAINCGDVIIAAPGSYGPFQGNWGTVGGCPSTSGGIDGKGGIYFATLLCGGSYVGACYITTKAPTSGNTETFQVTASNWAIEGWYVNTSAHGRAFETYACSYSGGMKHHVAFINDISANNLVGMGTNECGQNVGSKSVPSPVGTDYVAVVGMIAQNSAQDPICVAAIDIVGPGVLDTKAGTHYFVSGNFSYANANPSCRSVSDTEDFMADTWDAHNVTTQGVFSNNIGFGADRMCIQTFWQNYSANPATIKIYNNTCFKNNNYNKDNLNGEINIAATTKPIPWAITVQNNLAYQPNSTASGGGRVTAFAVYDPITSLTNGGNFFRAANTSCVAVYCNSTFDAETWGANTTLGTNTYTNPAFTNTADLLANRAGVPNCNAFANTTQCMGWNASTGKLTTPSIISDLVPTASGTAGKGYQLPSTTCAPNPDYPTWLKGIVYLQWNGSSLTENSGLITKPCGM